MTSIEQALEWHRAGQIDHAERAYRDLLSSDPKNADAANLLGLILIRKEENEEAVSLFKRAVDLFPNNASFILNYASALAREGQVDESRRAYDRALALHPESSESNAQYGLFLAELNEFKSAEPYLRRSVELNPEHSALRVNFGNALKALGELVEAGEQFNRALKIDSENPYAWNSLGECLQLQGEEGDALHAFLRATELLPNNAKFQANLGLALSGKGRLGEAAVAFEAALNIEPRNGMFLASYAALKRDAGELPLSLELFNRALVAKPNDSTIVSKYLYTLNFSAEISSEDIDREHMIINRCFEAKSDGLPKAGDRSKTIRVGFLSGDFRAHSVAYFLLPLLEHLDRDRFAVVCYSQTTHEDSFTERFIAAADLWRPIFGMETSVARELIRADEIDILIDLSGHTAGSRMDVLANKPAPLLLNWLGYPNRVGLETFDGRIVDSITDPEDSESAVLDEPSFRLDRCFLSYRSPYELPEVVETPAIRRGFITFGSFNNAAKLSEETLQVWKEILEGMSNSKLLLKSWQFGDALTRQRFMAKLCSDGVSEDRIDLRARTQSYEDHMALYGDVDIALDSFPYNGTTTTCEALWMGVPVVVLQGERHAARVGSSLLSAADENDLIVSSIDEYRDSALRLASDLDRLNERRLERRSKVERSELGDTHAFTRAFEGLLEAAKLGEMTYDRTLARWMEEGMALHERGDLKGAIVKYEAVLRKDPNRADASHYCGVARYSLGDYGEAVRLLDRATIEMPDRGDVWTHYGSALLEGGRCEDAIEAHEKAIALHPEDGTVLNNYANALTGCGRAEEALLVYKRSLDVRSGDAATWCNYSNALKSVGQLMDAVDAAKKASEIDPAFAGGWSMLGVALVAVGDADKGVAALRRAVEIQPSNSWYWSNLIFALQYSDTSHMEVLSEACRGFGNRFSNVEKASPRKGESGVLRLGFVSADFREHAVARFVLPVLKEAEANGFETVLYSDSPIEDDWTRKLEEASSSWRSIVGKSDAGVATKMHQDGLDGLIDLGGHSAKNRLSLFAAKPVRYQATWLGFPGSTGIDAMDTRIADAVSVTESEENFFPERVVRLGEGYHTIDLPEDVDIGLLPSLNGKAFAFGSFNNLAKASPTTLRLWAKVLKAVPDSVLILKAYQTRDAGVKEKLALVFEAAGIDRSRIVFEDPIGGYAEHLAGYHKVDVALDTYPYNGTTTTCEALWMGVPVVTLMGDRSASRVGASLLSQVALGDFVAKNEDRFIELAVQLASHRKELAELRAQLRYRVLSSSLGDARRFGQLFFGSLRKELENASAISNTDVRSPSEQVLEGNWVEFIDFGNGLKTSGDLYYPKEYDMLPSSLEGKSILDLSCIDGYWSVKAMEKGASRVAALPAEGFAVLDGEGVLTAPREPYFDVCRAALDNEADQMVFYRKAMNQLDEIGESFDWVLWLINANFSREPLVALKAIRSVCRIGFCLSVTIGLEQSAEANEGEMPWRPSRSGLLSLLEEARFSVDDLVELDAGNGTKIAMARCHPNLG